MPAVLLVYASTHGHTQKIATHIAETLRADGALVDLKVVSSANDIGPSGYDGVIIGGSVHEGEHQADLIAWAKWHAAALNRVPSSFFSICLTAAESTVAARRASKGYIADFADETGWEPESAVSFAGSLQYADYDDVTQLLMRLLLRRGPIDTSRDCDFTDWQAVERFGHVFAGTLAGRLIA